MRVAARGRRGAVLGGLAFICPGLVAIVCLAALFLAHHPPRGVLGAADGAGAAVPAVALAAAMALLPASWARAGGALGQRVRWCCYVAAGAVASALIGTLLVVVLLACGVTEVLVRRRGQGQAVLRGAVASTGTKLALGGAAGLGALAWVALKVGALSFGGGFVIIPLMQHDAVTTYHWMTGAQFLDAVALGQVTPGPVVQTVAVVGYAAGGVGGALLAAVVAFAPSFAFVLTLGPRLDRLRSSRVAQAFLTGAGACAIGAIAGAAVPLALALSRWWQVPVLVAALAWTIGLRRSTVACLVGAGVVGLVAVLCGAPTAH